MAADLDGAGDGDLGDQPRWRLDPGAFDDADTGITVNELAKRYIDLARLHKRSWQEDNRQLDCDVLADYGERPAASITADDIKGMCRNCYDPGSPRSAEKLLAVLRVMFNVGLGRGKGGRWLAMGDPWLTGENPCNGVVLPERDPDSGQPLTDKQLRRYLVKLPDAAMSDAVRDVNGCRRSSTKGGLGSPVSYHEIKDTLV